MLCPDIGSHDNVNQFPSKAISSFIIVQHGKWTVNDVDDDDDILSDQLHTIFSMANLDDKFKRTEVARRLKPYALECLYDREANSRYSRNIGICLEIFDK